MKNLLLNLSTWSERLKSNPLALFLDYDGTLSAIAPTPEEARLPQATRETLKALVKLENVKITIISGRALNDLKKMISVRGITFVGSYGIEFYEHGRIFFRVSKKYLRVLRALKQKLENDLKGLPGVILEDKPYSYAIHYRKAAPAIERQAKQVVLKGCRAAVQQGRVLVVGGKKVLEIMPPSAMNKGKVVKHLLRMWGRKYVPVFMGDDRSDEAAFKALCRRGLTIKVGNSRGRSTAEYYLNTVNEVRKFLGTVLQLRNECRLSGAGC